MLFLGDGVTISTITSYYVVQFSSNELYLDWLLADIEYVDLCGIP